MACARLLHGFRFNSVPWLIKNLLIGSMSVNHHHHFDECSEGSPSNLLLSSNPIPATNILLHICFTAADAHTQVS